MENVMKKELPADTLHGELMQWNRIEDLLQECFKGDHKNDRDFHKMKLAEYDRLYYRYGKETDLSRDERALMAVISYKRKKLAKAVYPGLIRRLLQRVVTAIVFRIRPVTPIVTTQEFSQTGLGIPIPVKVSTQQQHNEQDISKDAKLDAAQEKNGVDKGQIKTFKPHYGPDLGPRNSQKQGGQHF